MALAIVLVICATVIVVTYMLCRVREREQDLEDVYEDISLLRVSVDRFNSIEEVNASNLSCLSDHLKHVDEEIDEIQNELCNVHFTLYGRGHPVSLVTRDSAHERSGARPWAQRSRGAGFLPSRALPRVSITPRQLLYRVSEWL